MKQSVSALLSLCMVISMNYSLRASESAGSQSSPVPASSIVSVSAPVTLKPYGGPYEIDPDKPMVALTFDDGPSSVTPYILDLLAHYDSVATFFVIGRQVPAHADTVRRIIAEGSEIGNHTWSHKNLTNVAYDTGLAQILDTNGAVFEAAGIEPGLIRPPYGAVSDRVRNLSNETLMPLINWSIDTEDWRTRDPDTTYNRIMDKVSDGAIILCHDLYKETGTAMERVIPELIERGYQLVTVSQLLSYRDEPVETGRVYNKR